MIRVFHVLVVKNRSFLIHNLLDEISVVIVEVQACNKGNFLLSPSIDSIALCMFRV